MEALAQLDLSLTRLSKSKFRHIILCGDFNCPGVKWEDCYVQDDADDIPIQKELLDLSIRHGLTQAVNETTRYTTRLDLCFTLYYQQLPDQINKCHPRHL